MIEAGLGPLYRFTHEVDERETVTEIFRAMTAAKKTAEPAP